MESPILSSLVLIDCGSSLIPEIESRCAPYVRRIDRIRLDEAGIADFAEAGLLIVSGSPRLFTDREAGRGYPEQFRFLGGVSCPVLGICAGHQGIGLFHGARVFRGLRRRDEDVIEFASSHPVLDGIPSGARFAERHCEGISLPPGFRLLGSSAHYPVEIMVGETVPRIGVQFHPEISGEVGKRFFLNVFRWATEGFPAGKNGINR